MSELQNLEVSREWLFRMSLETHDYYANASMQQIDKRHNGLRFNPSETHKVHKGG